LAKTGVENRNNNETVFNIFKLSVRGRAGDGGAELGFIEWRRLLLIDLKRGYMRRSRSSKFIK